VAAVIEVAAAGVAAGASTMETSAGDVAKNRAGKQSNREMKKGRHMCRPFLIEC
jgi:hypothetical protein